MCVCVSPSLTMYVCVFLSQLDIHRCVILKGLFRKEISDLLNSEQSSWRNLIIIRF